MRRILCLVSLGVGLWSCSALAYTELVVFGDSLSDVGNVFANTFGFAAADPYVDGRLTNGGNYVDYLSSRLGLPAPVHSGDGGTNFAHGGAQIGLSTTSIFIDSLVTQKENYLADRSGIADPQALYIIYGGGNDVRTPSVNVSDAANDLIDIVAEMLSAGAETIVVPNLPDIGLTPEVTEFGQGAGIASTARTQLFNTTLTAGLNALDADEKLVRLDVFGTLHEIVADATTNGGAEFGFKNVVDDCWEGGPAGLTSGFGIGDPLFGSFPNATNQMSTCSGILFIRRQRPMKSLPNGYSN